MQSCEQIIGHDNLNIAKIKSVRETDEVRVNLQTENSSVKLIVEYKQCGNRVVLTIAAGGAQN